MDHPINCSLKLVVAGLLVALTGFSHADQKCLPEDASFPDGWYKPYPAHRVIGNLYAVGAEDLSVYLITSDEGHILINTGLEASTAYIQDNIESVGYRLDDVKILLTQQAHFDHTAALAEIKQLTGAQMFATVDDARVLADGGKSDAHFGQCVEFRFAPVAVDKILADGEVIELGNVRLTTHLHPGHTEGSSSYSMTVTENGKDYAVLIANMGTINPGKKMLVEPTYEGVSEDFAGTYQKQKAMKVDVWVAAHGSQYQLSDKHEPGQAYDPEAFVDPAGFRQEVMRLEKIYLEQVQAERSKAGHNH